MALEGCRASVSVLFPFVGDTLGGSHLSTIILIEELVSRGHRVLVSVGEKGPLSNELDRRGIGYVLTPQINSVATGKTRFRIIREILIAIIPLSLKLRKFRIDVVHTNDHRMHLLWTLPSKVSGVGHLWHQRTIVPDSRLVKYLIKVPTECIGISKFVTRSIHGAGRRKPTQVLGNPVKKVVVPSLEVKLCRQKILERSQLSGIEQIIGVFGQLGASKNSKDALKIVGALNKLPSLQVMLAFFGDDRADYWRELSEQAEQMGLASVVVYLGTKRPVEPWMAACNLILAPATRDGFGRALIEAMSLKVPVVAAGAGGHLEVIEHGKTGFLYEPGDISGAASVIEKALTLQQKKQLLISAGVDEADRYNEAEHTTTVESLYWSMIQRKRIQ